MPGPARLSRCRVRMGIGARGGSPPRIGRHERGRWGWQGVRCPRAGRPISLTRGATQNALR
eukprot:1805166-Prorocentrum_lima.AAC.1